MGHGPDAAELWERFTRLERLMTWPERCERARAGGDSGWRESFSGRY
jgi:hypothetical protein